MNKIDLKKFDALVDEKLLSKQKHPEHDLTIYNYTHMAQFKGTWTPELKMSRGLIVNSEGVIKARPFPKFFNMGELEKIPSGPFQVFDKLDGSLGIMYWVNGKPFISTRGSFSSEQAIKAMEILKKYDVSKFNPENTYLFEILYPENRIVLDYGEDEKLILLAVIKTESGEELDMYDTVFPDKALEGIPSVLPNLKEFKVENKEGFVIRYMDGFRMKIKFDEYVRLHRLITGVNKKRIWDLLRNNESLDELLERVPDEFYRWVEDTKHDLEMGFENIRKNVVVTANIISQLPTRKEQAIEIMKNNKEFSSIIFLILDDKPYEEAIWRRLKPEHEVPFKAII